MLFSYIFAGDSSDEPEYEILAFLKDSAKCILMGLPLVMGSFDTEIFNG